MLKMVDGTGIIGVDMVCPLGGAVSPPQPPNYDNVEMEGVGSLMLPNSLKAPLERLELIGNSVQGENPAPDNPKEIKNAGRKSKNLFNIADLIVGHVQKDGTINEKETFYRSVILDVPEDGKYRISFNSNNDYTMLYFSEAYINGVYSQPYVRVHAGNSNSLISLKKGKNILSFSTYNNNTQVDFPKDHNIIIAAESETLDYEPYGYFFDVKVTGKNLIKTSPILPKRWSNNIDNHVIEYITLKPHTTYTLAMEEDTKYVNDLRVRIFSKNDMTRWLAEILGASENKKKFTTKDDVECVLCVYHLLDYKGDVKQLQLVEGDISTPYEPYTEQTVQIALDEPLRGIGEYKDTITKDGVVRKIKRIVFDGSEDEKWALSNDPLNVTTNRFIIRMNIINTYYKMLTMCNKMAWKNINQVDVVGQTTHGVNFYITLPKDLAPDLQTFRTWLSQNPLTVDYVLAEPVTELLPESVQDQLSALHSENGTTHVFVESGEVPCGIKLTYRKEK